MNVDATRREFLGGLAAGLLAPGGLDQDQKPPTQPREPNSFPRTRLIKNAVGFHNPVYA
jgi:hypothetical protein